MKIYRNKKKVANTVLLDDQDMPLSYLVNNSVYADTVIKFNNDLLSLNKKEAISLYQKIDKNLLLFKENYVPAKEQKDYLLDKDGIITIKDTSKKASYRPTVFGYKYILQRNIPFSSGRSWDINIDFTGMEKVKSMLQGITVPNNIKFNSVTDNPDIKYYNGEDKFLKAMKAGGYKDNCNIYIVNSTYGNKILYNKPKIFDVAKPVLFNQSEYVIEPSWDIFNHDLEMSLFPRATYDYIKLTINHTPILIMQDRLNFKTILLCGKEIFTEPRLIQFLAENIVYAYSIGYHRIPEKADSYINTFISNNLIDYYYSLNNRLNMKHPQINLDKDIASLTSLDNHDYKLVYVETTNENVIFDYATPSRDIYFKKVIDDEPKKDNNESLIYTVNQELKFIDNVDYSLFNIEQLPSIRYNYDKEKLQLIIGQYYSSKYNIAKSEETIINISNIKTNYSLYMTNTGILKDQRFYILPVDEPSNDIKVADIIIKLDTKIEPTDTRIIGGGSSKFDNYEYIDTGNILGRPYRIGTSMVITLPKKYESHRDQLQEQIDKHISSSEAAVLLFKD